MTFSTGVKSASGGSGGGSRGTAVAGRTSDGDAANTSSVASPSSSACTVLCPSTPSSVDLLRQYTTASSVLRTNSAKGGRFRL
jgi:hypothetical protein